VETRKVLDHPDKHFHAMRPKTAPLRLSIMTAKDADIRDKECLGLDQIRGT
jgi:hypothetical protein